MRSFCNSRRLVLAVVAVLCFVSAVSGGRQAEDGKVALRRKLEEQNEPWPKGTKVLYKDTDGKVYTGSLQGYNDDGGEIHYVINWDDGEVEKDFNMKEVDQMAADAKNPPTQEQQESTESTGSGGGDDYTPWPKGTKVLFREDGTVYRGSLQGYNDEGGSVHYVINWTDGEVEKDFNMKEVDQMVADAKADTKADTQASTAQQDQASTGSEYKPWPKGTKVMYKEDGKWYTGSLQDFVDGSEPMYMIKWDDGETEKEYNLKEVDQMVADAKAAQDNSDSNNDKPWPKGTKVLYQDPKDGKWYGGRLDGYNKIGGKVHYMIVWDNGESEREFDLKEVDQMVAAAKSQVAKDGTVSGSWEADPNTNDSGGGMSEGGVFILTFFVLGAVVAFFGFFVRKRLRDVKRAESDLALEATKQYSDDPSEEKKIPDII